MPVTDPIADYLTRIRNALKAEKRWVDVPASNMKKRLSLILKHEGYVKDFVIIKDEHQGMLRIYLKYTKSGEPVIEGLKRISTPGLRKYVKYDEIPKTLGGLGVTILSTSMGLVTDRVARSNKTGGDIICQVW